MRYTSTVARDVHECQDNYLQASLTSWSLSAPRSSRIYRLEHGRTSFALIHSSFSPSGKHNAPCSSACEKSAKSPASMHTILSLSAGSWPSTEATSSSVGHSLVHAPTPFRCRGYKKFAGVPAAFKPSHTLPNIQFRK